MKTCLFLLTFMLSLNLFGQQKSETVLIKNISVIDVQTGKISANKNVYIKNGVTLIADKGMASKLLPDTYIDGTGKFLMPGLSDMHVHYPENDDERFFKLLTTAGITDCRIMKSKPEAIAFSKSNQSIPSMHIAYNFFATDSFNIDTIPKFISSLKMKGYDFIKIFGIKKEVYFDAIMAAAKKNKMIVCGHAISNIDPLKVLASGYRSIEHVGYFDKANSAEKLDSLLNVAAKNNVFICPTLDWSLMVYHSIPKDSLQYRAGYTIGNQFYATQWDTTYASITKQLKGREKQYADYMQNEVAKKIEILKKMRAKGIKIIAGSDAEEPYQTPGYSLLEELKQIQKAGYSNLELIQMVTTNANAFWGRKNIREKDFIVLSKNPINDISNLENVEYVIKGGKITDVATLLKEIK